MLRRLTLPIVCNDSSQGINSTTDFVTEVIGLLGRITLESNVTAEVLPYPVAAANAVDRYPTDNGRRGSHNPVKQRPDVYGHKNGGSSYNFPVPIDSNGEGGSTNHPRDRGSGYE